MLWHLLRQLILGDLKRCDGFTIQTDSPASPLLDWTEDFGQRKTLVQDADAAEQTRSACLPLLPVQEDAGQRYQGPVFAERIQNRSPTAQAQSSSIGQTHRGQPKLLLSSCSYPGKH